MSEPLSDCCVYCGSPDVLDDAWFCSRLVCWLAWERESEEHAAREARLPLTLERAQADLFITEACVWGTPVAEMDRAIRLLR